MHTLLFHDPGHFHAALTLRIANPRVARQAHVYAPAGPELDAFLALVSAFNSRDATATDWDVQVHIATDSDTALQQLIAERRGRAVVLAGKNGNKLSVIRQLHDAGFDILADKPWLTTAAALPDLRQVTEGQPLAIDIMTERFDVISRLRQRIATTQSLFGQFIPASAGEPAIEIGSVHHLYKIVNGQPLQRPPWFYDVRVQGDGMVDIQSHMCDQAQWLVAPDRNYDVDRDIAVDAARRWTTPVPLALFSESTGAAAFPPELADAVKDEVLQLACNGQIDYRLCGIRARQRSEWGQREPEGGGDLHSATIRGTAATIVIRQGPETGYTAELHVGSGSDESNLETRLQACLADWQVDFPGVDIAASDIGFQIIVPAALRTGHESHFPMVLDEFLDALDSDIWPARLAARIRTRYTLLALAQEQASSAA